MSLRYSIVHLLLKPALIRQSSITSLSLQSLRQCHTLQTCLQPCRRFQALSVCKIHRSQNASNLSVTVKRSYSDRIPKQLDLASGQNKSKPIYGLKRNTIRRDMQLAETTFKEMVLNKDKAAWTEEEWSEASAVLSPMLRTPWDVMCMKTLCNSENAEMAQSLMAYLESLTEPVNRVILAYYIALLGATSRGSKEQEEIVMRYYKEFTADRDLLDILSIELLVDGLSQTSHYLECLSLLEKYRENQRPSVTILVNILLAALRSHDVTICELMISEFDNGYDLNAVNVQMPKIVKTCLEATNEAGLEMVMDSFRKQSVLFTEDCLEQVADTFKKCQKGLWRSNYGYIHNRGESCVVCSTKMERHHVTDEDFADLRDAFVKQVIVGGNIFFRSTPEELERFIKFVDKQGPFDVVIDGLNVLFRTRMRDDIQQLVKAIRYFTDNGDRVLVLGSMALKPKLKNLFRIKPAPSVYMTTSTRADDVFFIYAALTSGKSTRIVSRDKLRDHQFKLEPQLRTVFSTWLQTNQIFQFFLNRDGDFGILPPRVVSIGPARDPGGWHFPLDDRTALNPFGKMAVLCLRRKSALPQIGKPRKGTKLLYQKQERARQQQRKEEKEWFEL